MQVQVWFLTILTTAFVQTRGASIDSGREDGNIWDMLIAQDFTNNDFALKSAPSNNSPFVNYGLPTSSYSSPSISVSNVGTRYVNPVSISAPVPINTVSNIGFSAGGTITPSGIIRPKLEILKLAENFLKLKGEIGSRLYAVIVDNWDLIRAVYNTAINNVGTLHAFTVNGIIILRKILEFAVQLFGNWQITVPNVSLDFSTLLRESNFNDI